MPHGNHVVHSHARSNFGSNLVLLSQRTGVILSMPPKQDSAPDGVVVKIEKTSKPQCLASVFQGQFAAGHKALPRVIPPPAGRVPYTTAATPQPAHSTSASSASSVVVQGPPAHTTSRPEAQIVAAPVSQAVGTVTKDKNQFEYRLRIGYYGERPAAAWARASAITGPGKNAAKRELRNALCEVEDGNFDIDAVHKYTIVEQADTDTTTSGWTPWETFSTRNGYAAACALVKNNTHDSMVRPGLEDAHDIKWPEHLIVWDFKEEHIEATSNVERTVTTAKAKAGAIANVADHIDGITQAMRLPKRQKTVPRPPATLPTEEPAPAPTPENTRVARADSPPPAEHKKEEVKAAQQKLISAVRQAHRAYDVQIIDLQLVEEEAIGHRMVADELRSQLSTNMTTLKAADADIQQLDRNFRMQKPLTTGEVKTATDALYVEMKATKATIAKIRPLLR